MSFQDEGTLSHLTDHECEHGAFPDDPVPRCHCWVLFDLQSRLEALRAGRAPLPMTDGQAKAQAVRLRIRGMTYSQIAVVMSVYHGQWFGEHHWRRLCRADGVPVIRRGYAPAAEVTP